MITFNLHQCFDVFAPRPPTTDFFYTLPANLTGGGPSIDLASIFEHTWRLDASRALTWAPPDGALPFASNRHRMLAFMLLQHARRAERLAFGDWLCRTWAWQHREHPRGRLKKWKLCYTRIDGKVVREPGAALPILSTDCVWEHKC